MYIMDKPLVYDSKLMGEQPARQAANGSAFTVLRSVMTSAWYGKKLALASKQALVISHRNRQVSVC